MSKAPNYYLNERIYENSDKSITIFKVSNSIDISLNDRQGEDRRSRIWQLKFTIKSVIMKITIMNIKSLGI